MFARPTLPHCDIWQVFSDIQKSMKWNWIESEKSILLHNQITDSKSKGTVGKLTKFWIRWSIDPNPWLDHFGSILGFVSKSWSISDSARVRLRECLNTLTSQFEPPEFESDLRFSPFGLLRSFWDHFISVKIMEKMPLQFDELFWRCVSCDFFPSIVWKTKSKNVFPT